MPRPPTPCPPGLPAPYAVASYAGSTRAMVLAYKERDVVALTRPLAAALRLSVQAALAASAPAAPVLVVPIPSTAAARRRRGYDPVERLAQAAGTHPLLRALTHVRDVRDSAGLSADARHRNLHGALAVRAGVRQRVGGRPVLLVDDVVTTGATLAEGARALRAAGAHVVAAAVIAATTRDGGAAESRPDLHNREPAHYGS